MSDLTKLAEPFAANDVEWRIGQSGVGDKGPWAKVLAYITNRAIMDRLDEVCGPSNWRNEFRHEANGAVMCGISIRVETTDADGVVSGREWVTKWDGAEATDIEAVKGGLSNAMKRAGVQWGIGRYLYGLSEGWAVIGPDGENYVRKNDKTNAPAFRWNPPTLPKWALPGFNTTTGKGPPKPVAPKDSPLDIVVGPSRIVKGKPLTDYSTAELTEMQTKLRTEGNARHKFILADVVAALGDDARVANMRALVEARDDLPFAPLGKS